MGYSSAPLFEQSVGLLEARPGQAEYLESFSVDPITGQPGSRSPRLQPVALEMQQAAKRGNNMVAQTQQWQLNPYQQAAGAQQALWVSWNGFNADVLRAAALSKSI